MATVKNFVFSQKVFLTNLAATLILLLMFLMALFSSYGAFGDPGDSAIVDEVAHIPSGYTYLKDNDYRLNPEHPPLAKALAAVPLVLNKNIVGPEKSLSWDGIGQWEAGWYMLYQTSNDPKTILDLSRLPMMLLMIALGLFIFKWAKELFGRKTALVVLLLYAFYPDVLAHGRLVTTDIAAAFGFVIATYYFDKAISKLTWRAIIYAALALALAQLLKFSAVLLFPIFFILIMIKAIQDRGKDGFWSKLWFYFKPFLWISIFSILFVWVAYIPFVFKTPAGIEHELIEINLTSDPHTLLFRSVLHYLENNAILRALGHYILGIFMVIGRVGGGNKTFILGHLSDKSISWFFPVAWLLKTPISIILLVFSSLLGLVLSWPKEKNRKWLLAVILVPIIFYWGMTLKGQLNIGIRHLMPTIPFVLLLIGYFIHPIINSEKKIRQKIIVGLLIIFMVGSTLYNYPNFIAYFNEFTPKDQRYQRLVDSSLDWGQDLLRLKKYIDDNNIKSIKVDYFGGSVPSYYIPQSIEWHANYGPTSGWLAVSATFYQSSKLVGRQEGKWSYDWLDSYKPEAIIGGSILVFNIPQEELYLHYPVSPYPITELVFPTNSSL
ncbi:MAG TPA: glycosyltransferase family 39 protein [Patescibacteria group bacterium]|nr:glycosyltransferase family 39 protein [Patescibacteria group bacterium]